MQSARTTTVPYSEPKPTLRIVRRVDPVELGAPTGTTRRQVTTLRNREVVHIYTLHAHTDSSAHTYPQLARKPVIQEPRNPFKAKPKAGGALDAVRAMAKMRRPPALLPPQQQPTPPRP